MTGAWNLADLSESELYDHLRTVIENSFETFAADNVENNSRNNRDDSDFRFETTEGRVNLLGVRGFEKDSMAPVANTATAWDDTCFVIYVENGRKRVESYYLNTEQNHPDYPGSSFLLPGNHRYRLGRHGDYNQRALEPYNVVATLHDENENMRDDEGWGISWRPTINIHYGGAGSTPVGWSAGCQTVRYEGDWDAMRERIESDHSIIGTIDNEFAPTPARDGDRVLIYTLVTGDALRPGAAGPVISDPVEDTRPGYQRPGNEQPKGPKGPGRRPGNQRPGNEQPKGPKDPGKRPGNQRPGNQRPGNEQPKGPKGPGKRPGNQRPDRAGGERWGSRPTIAVGSRGDDVEVLQRRLTKLGFEPGPIDGLFGSLTESGVRRFQTARDLRVDGIVGPQTWEALSKRVRRKTRAKSRS